MIPVDHHTFAQTKRKSDLCMLLHHTLHWAVYETSQVPLAHAISEGSDEPAYPHSLARGINAHIQGKSLSFTVRVYLNLQLSFLPISARNFFVFKQQRSRSASALAQFYQLSLESMIAKPATCKVRHVCADPDNSNGGVGGRVELLLEGGSYQFFF